VIRREDDAQSVPFAGQSARWTVTLACITVLTVAYVGYFGLLITCDLLRVAPLGFVPVFEDGAVTVGRLQPDSIGARAGIRTGDRLKRAAGQILEAPAGLAASPCLPESRKPVRCRDRAERHLVIGEPSPAVRPQRMGDRAWPTGSPGISCCATDYAGLRYRGRVQARLPAIGASRRAACSHRSQRCRWRYPCEWRPSGESCQRSQRRSCGYRLRRASQ
jgi:hypothetical protein